MDREKELTFVGSRRISTTARSTLSISSTGIGVLVTKIFIKPVTNVTAQVNRHGYPYFHCNFAEYSH